MSATDGHGGMSEHEWAPCFVPIPVAMATKALKRPCPSCGSRKVLTGPLPRATQDGDAIGWLDNGDTGTSSLTIWSVMMGRGRRDHDVPHDPDDFGRCYRLFKVMPSWRGRVAEVSAKYPRWTKLVEQWDAVQALYEEELPSGNAPKCYALIQKLIA